MPKQLTLSRDRPLIIANPYLPDSMSDSRAVIYAAAFIGAARRGLVTPDDILETTREVMARPQLSHIDGRPC